MKKRKKKSLMRTMQELGQRYGVTVTDMSERGVKAIGIIGGVRREDDKTDRGSLSTERASGGRRQSGED